MSNKKKATATETPINPTNYDKATGDPQLATLLDAGSDNIAGNTLVPRHKLKEFFNPEEEENPESGSIDPDEESGSQPDADVSDNSDEESEEESEEEEPEEESEEEEPEEESEEEEPEEEEEELDIDALLGVIPEDLRDEKDVEKSFENWVQDYYNLRKEKAEAPAATSDELEGATKKQNQLAQELAEAKKLIARQNQVLGGPQDAQPRILQPGQRAVMPSTALPAKKEVADSGLDLAKFGDFSEQEFKHDFFDEPDLALAERLQLFGKQLVGALGQKQNKQVEDYVMQVQTEQRLWDEWNQFTTKNPDFESVKTEMLEVFQANPDLNRTPGALETVYSEAKRLQKARFDMIANRLEEMGFQRPSSTQKTNPTRDDKGRFKPSKDKSSEVTMPEKELEKAKAFLRRRTKHGPATENMKQSSGKPSATSTKIRSRKTKPAMNEDDAFWQGIVNSEQGIHDEIPAEGGGTIGISRKPEREKGAENLKQLLKGI